MLTLMKYKYIGILLIGTVIGFLVGSWWVDKSGDEMMRQMTMVLMIARGN